MMKMLIGGTTDEAPDENDNLWGDELLHVTIDLNNLEETLDILESEVNATIEGAKGVLLDHLLKIWSIYLEVK